ncbi:TPA: hypothetical protein RG678_002275 [Vibrio alginolyticus]|nr:hypothetical protein [Vibrio alginolyticus]
MKKILYACYLTEDISSGVIKKISSQVKEMRVHYHVDLIVFTREELEDKYNKVFEGSTVIGIGSNFIRSYINKELTFINLFKINYDFVYLREMRMTVSLWFLLKRSKSIMEINGDVLFNNNYIKKIIKNFSSRVAYKALNGLLSVGSGVNKRNIPKDMKVFQIPNAYDLDNITPRDVKCLSGKYKVFFIYSNHHTWQGLDLILKWAELSPNIEFHLVGPVGTKTNLNNVHQYGTLLYDDYSKIMLSCDCAVSTLALFRRHETTCSSLKFCEYIAHGIPTVINYIETSVPNLEERFILKISNKGDFIFDNLSELESFVVKSRNINMKDSERNLVSLKNNVRERLEILERL